MMDQRHDKDWRDLCQAAATEEDPNKLTALVDEINKILDQLHRKPEFAVEDKKTCGGNSSSVLYAS